MVDIDPSQLDKHSGSLQKQTCEEIDQKGTLRQMQMSEIDNIKEALT